MPVKLKEHVMTKNQQNDKSVNDVNPTPVKYKPRPGTDPKQPANEDYDYRPDFGVTGGGVDHNPELNNEPVQNMPKKVTRKPKRTK